MSGWSLADRCRAVHSGGRTPVATTRSTTQASVIAIDGPAASGKSAVGSALAAALGFHFFDTGSLYRGITWLALRRGIPVDDPDALTNFAQGLSIQPGEAAPGAREATTVIIDGDDATPHLREPEVDRNVSLVSRVPGVRAALMRVQRELASVGHVVMAGRDIGSVVLPEADLKIYLDAPLRVRAKRRLDQLASSGRQEDLESIMEDLARRDRIDSSRDASPLTAASDAVIINTDGLSLEEVVRRIAALARG